jgi:hypothetical protein
MRELMRQDLYYLVWAQPMTKVAAALAISDVGLKKISHRHHIPTPPRGYWQKLAAGLKPPRPPLPPLADGERDQIEIRPPAPPKAPPPPPVSAAVQAAIEHEQKPDNHITVAKTLRNPHRIVAARLEEDARDRHVHRHDRWYLQTYKPIDGDVLSRRRLLIQSAIFNALEQRGYKLVIEPPYTHMVQIAHGPDRLVVDVRERMQQVRRPLTDKEHRERGFLSTGSRRWTQERHATGELVIGIHEVNTRAFSEQWRESEGGPLEERLNEIMVGVARRFEDLRERREQQELARKRQWEDDRRRYEQEQERKRETVRIRRLVQQAQDRHTAAEIRALVDAVQVNLTEVSSGEPADFGRWREWALAHADRIDPLQDNDILDTRVSDQDLYRLDDNGLTNLDPGHRSRFWGGWRGR